jgi:hypothetical protein
MYYRGAKAALIVFDLSKGYTVQKLARWRHDLLQFAEEGVVSYADCFLPRFTYDSVWYMVSDLHLVSLHAVQLV